MPRITVTSGHVDDQAQALAFYTDVLGFILKHDIPAGDFRWLTVVDPGDPGGTQLLLEPNQRHVRQSDPVGHRARDVGVVPAWPVGSARRIVGGLLRDLRRLTIKG